MVTEVVFSQTLTSLASCLLYYLPLRREPCRRVLGGSLDGDWKLDSSFLEVTDKVALLADFFFIEVFNCLSSNVRKF